MNTPDLLAAFVGISLGLGLVFVWYGEVLAGGILLALGGFSVAKLIRLWRRNE